MKGIVCGTCGHVVLKGEAPEKCPVCMSPKEQFKEDEKAINEPADAGNLTEAEKKHIPVVEVDGNKVNVKIGEIEHPMEAEHSILFIDVYADKEFAARVHLTPSLKPFVSVELKQAGKISVVELCNVHGKWIKEV